MKAIEVVRKVDKKLKEANKESLMMCWNEIFPAKECLCENTFANIKEDDLPLILEEVRLMIIDQLKTHGTSSDIIKIYNLLYSKKIELEDIMS